MVECFTATTNAEHATEANSTIAWIESTSKHVLLKYFRYKFSSNENKSISINFCADYVFKHAKC